MSEDNTSGSSRPFFAGIPDKYLWGIIFAALGLSTGISGFTLTSTDDRYRGADAERDFRIRDIQIAEIHENEDELKLRVRDLERSPIRSEISDKLRDFEERLRKIEGAK